MHHSIVATIEKLLKANNISYEKFEHESVRTSEEASRVRGSNYSLAQGTKALIVRVKKNGEKEFLMIVVPGDKRFDVTKVKKLQITKLSKLQFSRHTQNTTVVCEILRS